MEKEVQLYNRWLARATEDPDLVKELEQIQDQEEEISDRFYRELEFGTAGLRGVLGAGTNRMNIYTVRKATQGVADYVNAHDKNGSVAISFDSRLKSDVFAREAARVLAANGVKAYLYSELMPTPMLSFAVRALGCSMGIMVTASHNPSKYNGYKAYGPDGCQIANEIADAVTRRIESVDIFDEVRVTDFAQAQADGLIEAIPQSVAEDYYDYALSQSLHPDVAAKSGLKLVYTPLNGTGNKPVREMLRRIGLTDVTVVPEQEMPDGTFATCPFPNPEIKEALALGLALSEKVDADLLLATDPDADRVGIAVKGNDGYRLMTGNEVGVLLLNYIASQKQAMGKLPERPIAVKTIVTNELTDRVAEQYGVEIRNVLTGFKFIGDLIADLEKADEKERFLFGYEESYGYLSGTSVRDKDAVAASMLICEMAAFYRTQGKTLIDVIEDLYKQFGYHLCTQRSFAFEGEQGMLDMQALMADLRKNPPKAIGGKTMLRFADYLTQQSLDCVSGEKAPMTGLPAADVLLYQLADGSKAVIRPSGTEPKVKIYFFVIAPDKAAAQAEEDLLRKGFTELLKL